MEPIGRQRILVVDDEAAITDLVGLALRYEGFEVATAATGRDALSKAAEFAPDLAILDVMLPDYDRHRGVQPAAFTGCAGCPWSS